MYNIFENDINGKKINHKDMVSRFGNEIVTEELDNIPADRFLQRVNPFVQNLMLKQANYDYKPGEEPNAICTEELYKMDITEREEVNKRAKREIEYTKKMNEVQKEENEKKEINKKIRAKTKKRLEEEENNK